MNDDEWKQEIFTRFKIHEKCNQVKSSSPAVGASIGNQFGNGRERAYHSRHRTHTATGLFLFWKRKWFSSPRATFQTADFILIILFFQQRTTPSCKVIFFLQKGIKMDTNKKKRGESLPSFFLVRHLWAYINSSLPSSSRLWIFMI